MTFKTMYPTIKHYIDLFDDGKIILNKERIQLFEYLERDVLNRDDVYFDVEQIENCIDYIERWYFPLADFQKFLIPFSFLRTNEDGTDALFYDSHFWTMARGSGKNGLFSGLSNYFISPLHGIRNYNVDIVANSEDQAMVSFDEIYDMLDNNEDLKSYFYKNKTYIKGIDSNSILKFRTSSTNTKDGLRVACVGFDEIHEYMKNDQLEIFESARGKVKDFRAYYIGTNGFQRDGVYDQTMDIAKNILNGEDPYTRMFPWICKLDDLSEMNNFDMWQKANPMYHPPMTEYAKEHMRQQKRRYYGIQSGKTDKIKFTIKNMNTLLEDTNRTVVPKKELIAATRSIPEDTSDLSALGACDFAQARDFTACGVLFLDENEEYIWKHHSFVNQNFLNQFTIKAPIKEWQEEGLLTIIDEPLISVDHIVNWFVEMREDNPMLQTIVLDKHKLNTLKVPLEDVGFEVVWVNNPRIASGQVSDKIDRVFGGQHIRWGNDYMMRWYTNNVFVKYDASGNKLYEKKEELRRKTDGFMALFYAFYFADTNLEVPSEFILADIDF